MIVSVNSAGISGTTSPAVKVHEQEPTNSKVQQQQFHQGLFKVYRAHRGEEGHCCPGDSVDPLGQWM